MTTTKKARWDLVIVEGEEETKIVLVPTDEMIEHGDLSNLTRQQAEQKIKNLSLPVLISSWENIPAPGQQ